MTTGRQISPLARRVIALMQKLGLSQSELARRARVNRAFISDLVRGVKWDVRDEALAKLARALGVTQDYLTHGDDGSPPPRPAAWGLRPRSDLPSYLLRPPPVPPEVPTEEEERLQSEEKARLEMLETMDLDPEPAPYDPLSFIQWRRLTGAHLMGSDPNDRASGPKARIPVFEARGDLPLRVADGEQSRWTIRPPALHGVPGVYAVVWPDDSLEPRIRRGEMVVCAPALEVRRGDDVIVISTESNEVNACARLRLARRGRITLEAFPDGREVEYDRRQIRLHRVALIAMVSM
jgi:transcriptional regulator with XRE-family HTH domain